MRLTGNRPIFLSNPTSMVPIKAAPAAKLWRLILVFRLKPSAFRLKGDL
jgi:hypothetical protein